MEHGKPGSEGGPGITIGVKIRIVERSTSTCRKIPYFMEGVEVRLIGLIGLRSTVAITTALSVGDFP